MSILQDPRIRVVIVIVVTIAIVAVIVIIMRGLLTKPPKVCHENTHLDKNINICVPNCQNGYVNDPITGECVINCPDGQVSSKSLSDVTVPGGERCVVSCGTTYCDPLEGDTLCQEDVCYKPNCTTENGQPSHCNSGFLCGTDSYGIKKTTLSPDITLDKYGCYSDLNSVVKMSAPVCPSATPNLISGTGTYSKEHVCCKTTEFAKYSSEGEPFCCPDENDKIINRKCCPQDQVCTVNGIKKCMTPDQVCTEEGICKLENAIGNASDGYTGCCLHPTTNGKCYNICHYVGESETGMKDTCKVDSDCNFKPGFAFDGTPIAGGVCDNGNCKLYCGLNDTSNAESICINDPNSLKSSCVNINSTCKFTPETTSETDGVFICDDNSTQPPKSYWKSNLGSVTLTVNAGMENPKNCTIVSCLERMVSDGLLGVTTGVTNSGKQTTLPKLSGTVQTSLKNSDCKATIECNKMKILQDDKIINWPEQTIDKTKQSIIMNKTDVIAYDGSWHGDGLCFPGENPTGCLFLQDGTYAANGTFDGVTPQIQAIPGKTCAVASNTDKNKTYTSDNSILCDTFPDINSTGLQMRPRYYCTSWNVCCGEGGIINSLDYTKCQHLANATCDTSDNICTYNVDSGGEGMISNPNIIHADGYGKHQATMNAAYLSLKNTLTKKFTIPDSKIGNTSLMSLRYSSALIVMTHNNNYLGFDKNKKTLGHVTKDSPINFYYTYCEAIPNEPRVWPNDGQISLFKGYFRLGSGPKFDREITISELGRPIQVTDDGAYRNTTWTGHKMFNHGGVLTLVKSDGKWYLATGTYFYWKWAFTFGVKSGDLKYGLYNPSSNKFEFTADTVSDATAIELKYVFSSQPDISADIDDKFLKTRVTVKKLLAQARKDSNFTLTFGDLESNVKESV